MRQWTRWALIAASMTLSFGGPARAQQVGDPAPAFTLEESRGGEVSLGDFANKVVFLNFFGFN